MTLQRVGRVERDAAISHVNEAFHKEYLDEVEREERVDRAAHAVTAADLDRIIADLPSMPFLLGKVKVPGKISRAVSGVKTWKSSPWLYTATGFLAVIITLPVSLLVGCAALPGIIKFPAVAASIVVGVAIGVITIFSAAVEFNW